MKGYIVYVLQFILLNVDNFLETSVISGVGTLK